MRFSNRLLCLCGILACLSGYAITAEELPAGTSSIGKKIQSFEAPDFHGNTRSLEEWKSKPVMVIVFTGVECPLALKYSRVVEQLAKRFPEVAFVLVDSNVQDTLTEMSQFARVNELSLPFLKDRDQSIANSFGATRTPEAFVLDDQRVIRYQGRIDNQFTIGQQRPKASEQYVVDAIESLGQGQTPKVSSTEAPGCLIGRPSDVRKATNITFHEHVNAIFQKHCVECHREGAIGPFSLTSYEEARGWADMIDEVVGSGQMPPWHANPEYGQFANDARMSKEEKDLIHQWALGGAPEGDTKLATPPREFVDGWQIGTPDEIFYISDNGFQVPSEGVVNYQYFVVDPGFKEDKWIRASEFQMGAPEVVHHILILIDPPKESGATTDFQGTVHSDWLSATAPGAKPMNLPEGMAKLVPAGSKLVFQMHYTPNGRAQVDRSCFGVKYADPKTVRIQVGTDKAAEVAFAIPPHASNHKVTARHRFKDDMVLMSMFPHMHVRGKSFRYTAIYPDGREEILLDVPRYDFNWQLSYHFAEPKLMPAGSYLFCEATYDNSDANLSNPNPNTTVRWGDQTFEEMMIGYFAAHRADQDLRSEKPERGKKFFETLGDADFVPSKSAETLAANVAKDPTQENWRLFFEALRSDIPQLDRICLTELEGDRLFVRHVAQVPLANRSIGAVGESLDERLSVLASYARKSEMKSHADLLNLRNFDLRHMSRVFRSSAHVPITAGETRATVNFWSREKDGFNDRLAASLQKMVEKAISSQ